MRRSKWPLAVFAALVGGMLSTTAAAVPGSAKSNATNQTATSANVAALHQAHKLLETAIHDYDGHRGKAAHLVKEAIHELGGNHQGKHKAAGTGGNANKNAPAAQANANQLSQQQSDAQLQEAIKILTTVEGNLTNHPKAAEHIKTAIAELNTALKIK